MRKDEMRTFVLRMFKKEKAIWRVWEAQGNPDARAYLEKVDQTERAFLEAVGHD